MATEKVSDGSEVNIPCGSVVLALGVSPKQEVVSAFQAAFDKVRAVGDARRGGRIATAIREGFEAGYTF